MYIRLGLGCYICMFVFITHLNISSMVCILHFVTICALTFHVRDSQFKKKNI